MSSSRRFDLQLIEKAQSIPVEDTELKVVVSKLNKSLQTGMISRHRAQLIPEFILVASHQVKILLLGLLSLLLKHNKVHQN